jgi:uncharacterized protein (DUF885 family)
MRECRDITCRSLSRRSCQHCRHFRQHAFYVAYGEGWALYAERMGEEVGFYQDPYSMFGHLQDDLLRAIRLVVDTGFHYKHWSRQQVVDYFHANSGIDEPDVQSETDRYIAWPGAGAGVQDRSAQNH